MPRLPYYALVLTLLSIFSCAVVKAETLPQEVANGESRAATTGSDVEELQSEFVPLSLLSDSLWHKLIDNFEFADIDNARVNKQVKSLQSGVSSLHNSLVKARPYLFHIADQLERAEIPLDIALLPLIESAFDPVARSNQSAVGIWQFIPSTAVHYGLTVERHFDQRHDVVASTSAAVRYLNDLNIVFDGDWLLTLAAYNTGPANVRNAISRAKERGVEATYWNLDLSRETRDYVPRLIATTKLIRDSESFNLVLPPIPDQRVIEQVSVGRRISLQQITDLTSASLDELNALNPGLYNGLTPIDGPHHMLLPVDVATRFHARVKKLEYLPSLDRQTQLELVRRNISNPIVASKAFRNDSGPLDLQNYNSSQTSNFETHTVRYGDTLWSLAKKVGVDVDTLRTWNNLEDDEPIKEGDVLNITYIATESENAENAGLMNYRVAPTDSLSTIAAKFDLAVSDIQRWNDSVKNEDFIQAGQLLRIPTFPSNAPKYSLRN